MLRLDPVRPVILVLGGGLGIGVDRVALRLPLLGPSEYALPETIEARLGGTHALAEGLLRSPIELVVCATDVTDTSGGDDPQAGDEGQHHGAPQRPVRLHQAEELGGGRVAELAASGQSEPVGPRRRQGVDVPSHRAISRQRGEIGLEEDRARSHAHRCGRANN